MEAYGSPPSITTGFFPHDLNDIYEYKTDHQYFTHTGTSQPARIPISSDNARNSIFHRNHNTHSLDEYSGTHLNRYGNQTRLDNASFIRGLHDDLSPKERSRNNSCSSTHKTHHHSSVHEMIKHLGKKVHIWPRKRHDSTNNMATETELINDEQENFRSRSKSLDVNVKQKKILGDCDATYKVFDKIVKEGIFVVLMIFVLVLVSKRFLFYSKSFSEVLF